MSPRNYTKLFCAESPIPCPLRILQTFGDIRPHCQLKVTREQPLFSSLGPQSKGSPMHPSPGADIHESEALRYSKAEIPGRQFNQTPRYLQITDTLYCSRTHHGKHWQVGHHKDV